MQHAHTPHTNVSWRSPHAHMTTHRCEVEPAACTHTTHGYELVHTTCTRNHTWIPAGARRRTRDHTQTRGGACYLHTRVLSPALLLSLHPPRFQERVAAAPGATRSGGARSTACSRALGSESQGLSLAPAGAAGPGAPCQLCVHFEEMKVGFPRMRKKEMNLASCAPFLTLRTGRAAPGHRLHPGVLLQDKFLRLAHVFCPSDPRL